jgi:hypothetical protein
MTNDTSSNPFLPPGLIDEAKALSMDRFNLDSVRAFEVLRTMSQNTRTSVQVVAEQVINHDVPVEAVRGIEDAMRDCG